MNDLAETNQAKTPSDLLAMAVAANADLAKLEKLMELQERWEKNEARKAFHVAVTAFKNNPPAIIKDMVNKQYDSMYSSLSNFVNTVSPELSKHGLSARWDMDQTNGIKITCILSHVLGHSESISMSGPADDSGKKNALQQIKSTVTYLEGATFQAITGLVSSNMSADDDGNGAGVAGVPESQKIDFESAIEALTDRASGETLWSTIVKTCNDHKDKATYDILKAKITEKMKPFKAKTA